MRVTEESIEGCAATASYIEDMLGELAMLVENMKCDFLVFLLEMAKLEAANVKNDNPTPGRKPRKNEKGKSMNAEELAAIFVRKYSSKH